jgi:hypothetical protein
MEGAGSEDMSSVFVVVRLQLMADGGVGCNSCEVNFANPQRFDGRRQHDVSVSSCRHQL